MKLAVIHFSPVEGYPPVMNWINFVAGKSGVETMVITRGMGGTHGEPFVPSSTQARIHRSPAAAERSSLLRLFGYFRFYWKAFRELLRQRPDVVLYYETLSSLPALLYKRVRGKKTRLYIHYHEYTTPEEYRQGMAVSRRLHSFEKKEYHHAEWLSHTNTDRIKHFQKDMEGVRLPPMHVLPNYPPAGWSDHGHTARPAGGTAAKPLRLVYVGALSLDTMYTRELCTWILGCKGQVGLDIYSGNISADAIDYLASLKTKGVITLHPPVNYFSLPETLAGYDVGVILYKGHIPNYVYNAPNKLFEYLACGLDVWLPDVLKGSLSYVDGGVLPKVLAMDFGALEKFDWREAMDHAGRQPRKETYVCENVLETLYETMIKKDGSVHER